MRTYIFLLVALLGLGACNDFLEETPKGTMIPKTVEDFGLILEAGGTLANEIAVGANIMVMMDDDIKLTDDAQKTAGYKQYGLRSYRWEEHLFTVNENDPDYNALYHTIYLCNYILENIDDAKEGGQFSKAYVEGSARFHRAFSYLYLVNLYAQHYDAETAATDLGVALVLEANPNVQYGRATVKAVYDQILEDAKKAAVLLEDTEFSDQKGYLLRASNGAAYALLARIYLYRGEYGECWKAAQKAGEYIGEPYDYNRLEKLSDNPDDEGIVDEDFTDMPFMGNMDGWAMPDVICYKQGNTPLYTGDYNLSDELIGLFDQTNDLRWTLFVTTYSYYGEKDGDEPRVSSFFYPNNTGLNIGELYITEAEALVRDGDIDGALRALNTLGEKRYSTYTEVTERDPEKLLKLILEERRREQMFKGTRLFDLKRLNKDPRFAKTVTHKHLGQTYTLEPNSNRYVLPFPLKVTMANPLLEQNPR